MSQVFHLPDLGEGLTDAAVVEWRVSVGDTVEIDEIVVEVETAKATVEVPCPYAGRVEVLHAAAGEVLPVGQPLVTVRARGDDLATDAPAARAYREQERAGSGNVLIGYGTTGVPERRRRRRPRPAPAEEVAASATRLVISPLVRRLARDHGVDLTTVDHSGAGGVVRRGDVESAIAARDAAPRAHHTGQRTGAPSATEEIRLPLKGLRRAVAEKVVTSRREIPEVTIWADVDATALLHARSQLNDAGLPVSLLAMLARISVLGLRRFPELNSRVDTMASEIVQLPAIHLGIAAQTDRGLVVPVVRDAAALSLMQLSGAIDDVVTRARLGTLSPAELTGGTFTLNNYGVFGVDGSTPIINHPEAAIVGIGRVIDRPWVVEGRLEVRKVVQLVLAFDHRVCDGVVAGGYLRLLADYIESPVRLIGEL